MSASYVVLSTPHSRWIIALDPFDDLLAEDAVRPDHQGQDHQDVRREVLGPPPTVGATEPAVTFPTKPANRPPTPPPRNQIGPARITTGNTLSPTSDRLMSTPSRLPQMMPPSAET